MRLIKSWEFVFFVAVLALGWFSHAEAGEKVMVTQFNENVLIVLKYEPCPMMEKSLLATAYRVDGQSHDGCWTPVTAGGKAMVHIQWSAEKSDFSELPKENFKKPNFTGEM